MTQSAFDGFDHKEGTFLAVGAIAKIYGVDERTVQYWVDRGWCGRHSRGEYRLEDVVPGVYTAQQELINRKKGPEGEKMTALELREQAAKTERVELEVARMRGDLLDAEDVKKQHFEEARKLRDALENMPARISDIIAAESDPHKVKILLMQEVKTVLTELSGQ